MFFTLHTEKAPAFAGTFCCLSRELFEVMPHLNRAALVRMIASNYLPSAASGALPSGFGPL